MSDEELAQMEEALTNSQKILEQSFWIMSKVDLTGIPEENKKRISEMLLAGLMKVLPEEGGEFEKTLLIDDDGSFQRMLSEGRALCSDLAKDVMDSATRKCNHKSIVMFDKVSQNLTVETSAVLDLGKKKNENAKMSFMLLDIDDNVLDKPLSYTQKTVLKVVYSLVAAGNTVFTSPMIYKALRGGADVFPSPKAQEQLDQILKGLRRIFIKVKMEDENEIKNLAAEKWTGFYEGDDALLDFNYLKGMINGQLANTYVLKPRQLLGKTNGTNQITYEPLLLTLTKSLNHYEMLPESVLNVKVFEPKTGKDRRVQIDMPKAVLVSYLIDRIIIMRRAKGIVSDKIPYSVIWEQSEINSASRQQIKRNKDFVAIVLNHFKREGFIYDWKEYATKAEECAGVQISMPKAPELPKEKE